MLAGHNGSVAAAILIGLLLLSAAIPPAGAAEMYQWVDANGKRHFTDKPPPAGVNAERAVLRPAPALTAPAADAADDEVPETEVRAREQQRLDAMRRENERQWRDDVEKSRLAEQARQEAQRREREAKLQADKDEKCERLKDVADKAYAFRGRYEKECR